jgi:hypothetical protein
MVEEEFPVQRLQQRLQKFLRNKHATRASCLDCGGELSVEVKILLAFFIVDRSDLKCSHLLFSVVAKPSFSKHEEAWEKKMQVMDLLCALMCFASLS